MCWTQPRWRPTVWSKRAALSSVAFPPWALWRASSTARLVKKTQTLCHPLSLCNSNYTSINIFTCSSLFVVRFICEQGSRQQSWLQCELRENYILTYLLLFSFLPPSRHPGDYLVTIEEKNSATYLRAYTNWRYQVHTDQLGFLTSTLYHSAMKCKDTLFFFFLSLIWFEMKICDLNLDHIITLMWSKLGSRIKTYSSFY